MKILDRRGSSYRRTGKMFKVPAMSDPVLWMDRENIQAVSATLITILNKKQSSHLPPLICVHCKVTAHGDPPLFTAHDIVKWLGTLKPPFQGVLNVKCYRPINPVRRTYSPAINI